MTIRPRHLSRRAGALALAVGLAVGAALSGCSAAGEESSPSARGQDVYDESVLHEIDVDLDPDDFTTMMESYAATGTKDWVRAAVTIDGTTYRDAGLRLKGNSSLRGADADSDPAELPWLIRLDEFVDRQAHQGWTELVVRSSSSATSLEEAVALDLLEETGLASEHAVAPAFSVGDSDPVLRLVVQHLDEAWEEENFESTGWLYKAEAEGDWSYRGADPESYEDVFDQETGEDDLTPLIEFLDFVNNADDDTFAAELPDRLDVESFATYLAFQDLIGNWDDIDGPGNNAYLRWDAEAEQFTVVAWDHNLAFGGSPGSGGGPAGGGRDFPGAPPGAPGEDGGDRPAPPQGATPPEGFEPPEGFDPEDLPEGFDPENLPDGLAGPPGGGRGPGGPGGSSNPLVERFGEVEEFAALVEDAEQRLRTKLLDSGRAQEILEQRVAVLGGTDLVDEDELSQDAEAIRTFLTGAA